MQLPNYTSPSWRGVNPHRRRNQHGQRNHRRRHWRLQLCEYRSIEQRCIASTLMTAFHPSRCSEKCCPTIIEFGIDSAVLASPLLDYRRRRLMTCPPALARMSLRTLRDVAAHQLRQSHQLHQFYSRINFTAASTSSISPPSTSSTSPRWNSYPAGKRLRRGTSRALRAWVRGGNRGGVDRGKPRKGGEPCWIRTSDLLIKSQLLYRLS